MKILANDGISESGVALLKSNGFDVSTDKIEQEIIRLADEYFLDVLALISSSNG